MRRVTRSSGFSLVEGSVVLVVVGLVAGGVLMGKNLLEAAYARNQVAQIQKFETAVNSFEAKYQSLPGDMTNRIALAYGFAARGADAGEGDGNGVIEGVDAAGNYGSGQGAGETVMFWKDLAKAGLLDGTFTSATPDTVAQTLSGSDVSSYLPQSALGGANYLYVWSNNTRVVSASSGGTGTSISSASASSNGRQSGSGSVGYGNGNNGNGNGNGNNGGNCNGNNGNGNNGNSGNSNGNNGNGNGNGGSNNGNCNPGGGGNNGGGPGGGGNNGGGPVGGGNNGGGGNNNGSSGSGVTNGYVNYVGLSSVSAIGTYCPGCMVSNPSLSPSQALNIDKKMDDGMPQSGKVQAKYITILAAGYDGITWAGAASQDNDATTAATPASAASCYDNANLEGAAQQYSTGNGNPNCGLSFILQ